MNEWGIPDWTDESAYGDTTKWGTKRWFWEFLRRRWDIRREFDAKKDAVYAQKLELYEVSRVFSPGGVLKPDEPGFTVRTRLIYPNTPKHYFSNLLNPRIGKQPESAIPYLPDHSLRAVNKEEWIEFGSRHASMDFDLDRPLQPQIDTAVEMLKGLQEVRHGKKLMKRRHQQKWLTYLRVLDAREAGATWAEIARILPAATVATEQTARDTYKQAEALCYDF